MVIWSKAYFNQKIDSFSEHSEYSWLREKADSIVHAFDFGPVWATHAAEDFMNRIIAMPEDYIREWLDGKNALHWRDEDKRMLKAIKGGYVDVLEAHPNADIQVITERAIPIYEEYGYEIVRGEQTVRIEKSGFALQPRVFAVKDKGLDAVLENADERSGATQLPISNEKLEIEEFASWQASVRFCVAK